jgi:hypothetical protein
MNTRLPEEIAGVGRSWLDAEPPTLLDGAQSMLSAIEGAVTLEEAAKDVGVKPDSCCAASAALQPANCRRRNYLAPAPASCFWSSTWVSIWTRRGLTLSFSGTESRSIP